MSKVDPGVVLCTLYTGYAGISSVIPLRTVSLFPRLCAQTVGQRYWVDRGWRLTDQEFESGNCGFTGLFHVWIFIGVESVLIVQLPVLVRVVSCLISKSSLKAEQR
jgi:hypothetical protein